ncbi:MAG TPA: diaminopimelate epimerase [Woeseiaceae bacterium]|nr:diaminopimelate epimerase [Woeseiaceae bacterium]
MQIRYVQMEGAGNRILVVDERRHRRAPPSPDAIRALGDTATGPGFDQLMWVLPAASAGAVASYRVFNRDGSEVEQCGNGVRCVARLLADAGDAPAAFWLESPAGPVEARITAPGRVAVDMGVPEFNPEKIPFVAEREANFYDLDVNGQTFKIGAVSMGNPHCVLDVDDVSGADVASLGPRLERHHRFPARTNVGFMARRTRDEIDLRVFERGVGETLACGTGACAAVAVGRRRGELDANVRVNLPGGQLVVSWPRSVDRVWLTGNAEPLREGIIDL